MTTATRRVAAGAVLFAVLGLVVNLWRPLAPGLGAGTVPQELFSRDVLDVVQDYGRPRLWTALGVLALGVLVPVAMLASARLRVRLDVLAVRLDRPVVGSGLIAVVVVLAIRLAALAPTFWVSHVREVAWGFRTAGPGAWLVDWGLAVLVEAVTAGVAVALLVWLIRRRPEDWHWWMAAVTTALAAVLTFAYPVLVEPLFLETRPLEQGPVRDGIEDVLQEAGMQAPILVGDASRRTTRVNAFVTGLGPTRRVVLWDNLLDRPTDEVLAVVAHELAHREHRDLPRGVLLTAAGVLPLALVLRRVIGARNAADPRTVLILAVVLSLAQVVALPPALWFSRRAEAAADHRALELTDDPDPLLRTFRGFVTRDLSQPSPPPITILLFGSHPPVDERIRAIVQEAGRRGIAVPTVAELEAGERADHHPRILVREP